MSMDAPIAIRLEGSHVASHNGLYVRGAPVCGRPAYYHGSFVIADPYYERGMRYGLYGKDWVFPDADCEIWTLGKAGLGPVSCGLYDAPYPTVTAVPRLPLLTFLFNWLGRFFRPAATISKQ